MGMENGHGVVILAQAGLEKDSQMGRVGGSSP